MKYITEFIIKLICFIILFLLNILIFLHGRTLSCDKCQIHFQSDKTTFNEVYDYQLQSYNINISLLYDSYINNDCYISYDSNGFTIHNKTK